MSEIPPPPPPPPPPFPDTTAIISTPPSDSVIPLTLPISIKLNHTNYLTWKSQITPIIHGYNLAMYIDSPPPVKTIVSPTGALSINPDYLIWHRQDQLLLGWIRSSLTESLLAQVVSCTTTADLWNTLLNTFSSTSRARISDLRRQFQSMAKGSLSCTEYLNKLRNIADELAFIGSPVSDEDLVLQVLNGLGPEYNSFYVAVNIASRRDPLSFTEIHGLLLSHESLLTTQHSSSSSSAFSSPTAFYSRPNFNRSSNRPPKPNTHQTRPSYSPSNNRPSYHPLLPNPSQPNYLSSGSVPFNPKQSNYRPSFPQSNSQKTQCQICAKFGHTAKNCRWRYSGSSSTGFARQPTNTATNTNYQAYTAQPASSAPAPSEWILDSGATHHITGDLNNLSNFFHYTGTDSLQTGSATGMPIQHFGSTTLSLKSLFTTS